MTGAFRSTGERRHLWLAGAGLLALAMPAAAQTVSPATASPAATAAEPRLEADAIVVTGSRIARSGYDAPTPVSVVTEAELKAEPQANIGDYVNTLPAVRGSQTSSSNSGSLSNGQAGIATVNLRNLGAVRTLVLVDGARSVASSTTGLVDVQTIPQGLIRGVEVVTGGASSVYGSDAVAGIINFQLNTDFKGLRAEYEYGVTTYGDAPNHTFRLTAGTGFAGGRGKIVFGADYFRQQGVDTIARRWNDAGFFQIDNPLYVAGNGQPERFVGAGIGTYQFTQGGIVNSGPLRGTYFGSINPANGQASLNQFVYGPNRGQWMIGGDYLISRQGHLSSNSLVPHEDRYNFLGRVAYEVFDGVEVFAQASYSGYQGRSFYQQTPSPSVVIQRDNAFLPTEFVNRMIAANVTSVTIGTSNVAIPAQGSDNERSVQRYVLGVRGDFATGKIDWKWDGYYQKGITNTTERLTNTWVTSRLLAATDAVRAPAGNALGVAAGTIVCRSSLTAPTNGCVPLNRIGTGAGDQSAALAYIFNNGQQPLREQRLTQDVAQVNLSTNELFDTWAGPVSLAVGGEWRKESVNGTVDPQFNSGWLYGNYRVTAGSYNVKEAYAETVVPLWQGLDFNGALRVTDYSTSGTVTTWKAGATWQLIEDFKLRVTRSRDIRAPNLSELFAPGTARTNTVNVPLPGGGQRTDTFLELTTGNTALKPEKAMTWGIGGVLTPRFLPGFAASVDYFDINLTDAINTISAQNLTTLCIEQGRADSCQFLTFGGTGSVAATNPVTQIRLVPFNFARQQVRGLDIEASYRFDLGDGRVTLRGLASHFIRNLIDSGLPPVRDLAGQNAGGGDATPSWNFRLSANYDNRDWSFSLIGRGFSSGVYDNNFIACTTGCPVSTPLARTINTNRVPGQWYLDASLVRRFAVAGTDAEFFVYVRNLLNADPPPVGNGPTGDNTPAYPQTNRSLYDVLGRVFRLGVRVKY